MLSYYFPWGLILDLYVKDFFFNSGEDKQVILDKMTGFGLRGGYDGVGGSWKGEGVFLCGEFDKLTRSDEFAGLDLVQIRFQKLNAQLGWPAFCYSDWEILFKASFFYYFCFDAIL